MKPIEHRQDQPTKSAEEIRREAQSSVRDDAPPDGEAGKPYSEIPARYHLQGRRPAIRKRLP